jgi:hypothetical protein
MVHVWGVKSKEQFRCRLRDSCIAAWPARKVPNAALLVRDFFFERQREIDYTASQEILRATIVSACFRLRFSHKLA